MKIDVELLPRQEAILRAIAAGARFTALKVSYDDLCRIMHLAEVAEVSLDRLAALVTGHSGSNSPEHLDRDIHGLEFLGLVEIQYGNLYLPPMSRAHEGRLGFEDELGLTDEGLRVATALREGRRVILRPRPSLRTTVFVACAFGYEQIDELFELEFVAACNQVGYEPIRVDMSEPSQTITDHVIEAITEAVEDRLRILLDL